MADAPVTTSHERFRKAVDEWSGGRLPVGDIWDLVMAMGDQGLTMGTDEQWDELYDTHDRLRTAIEEALEQASHCSHCETCGNFRQVILGLREALET